MQRQDGKRPASIPDGTYLAVMCSHADHAAAATSDAKAWQNAPVFQPSVAYYPGAVRTCCSRRPSPLRAVSSVAARAAGRQRAVVCAAVRRHRIAARPTSAWHHRRPVPRAASITRTDLRPAAPAARATVLGCNRNRRGLMTHARSVDSRAIRCHCRRPATATPPCSTTLSPHQPSVIRCSDQQSLDGSTHSLACAQSHASSTSINSIPDTKPAIDPLWTTPLGLHSLGTKSVTARRPAGPVCIAAGRLRPEQYARGASLHALTWSGFLEGGAAFGPDFIATLSSNLKEENIKGLPPHVPPRQSYPQISPPSATQRISEASWIGGCCA